MNDITSPTLLINETVCRENIKAMINKSKACDFTTRPHFKTHQSLEIGRWLAEEGVRNITVSSLRMARYFAGPWEDITLAVPFNILAIDDFNDLAQQQKIILMVDCVDTTSFLAENVSQQTALWIEIDTGDHRTGLAPEDTKSIIAILDIIMASPKLSLKGFYSHAGHSYKARGKGAILEILGDVKDKMVKIRKEFNGKYGSFDINIGDTPCCSLGEDLSWVDSISAGNYVFYDVMQTSIGSCNEKQVAVCMVCPVISKNEERMEIAIHGGVVHFGKDVMNTDHGTEYGKIVRFVGNWWDGAMEGCRLKYISQEHGIIKVDRETFESTRVGDLFAILPVHSCITADCMGSYQTLDGKIIDHMKGGTNF